MPRTDYRGYSPGSPFYTDPSAGFNLSPAPQTGQGPYGMVPGQLGLPTPAADLGAQAPGLQAANAAGMEGLIARLGGQLSPGTNRMIQDATAAWGVGHGLPGFRGLVANKGLRDLGLMSENVQHQAIQDYANLIPTISRTQTVDPNLQYQIALQNSLNAAAPDPTQANLAAQALFNRNAGLYRGAGYGGYPGRGGADPAAFVKGPWAMDVINPPPMGGRGNMPADTYANQSNFGGYGGVPGIGTSSFGGGGGMTEYDWIQNQGFDPAYYGVNPPNTFYAGGTDMFSPYTPAPGGSYQFPPQQQGPQAPSFEQMYPNLSAIGEGGLDELLGGYNDLGL